MVTGNYPNRKRKLIQWDNVSYVDISEVAECSMQCTPFAVAACGRQ